MFADGEVENQDACVHKVKQFAHNARVFTFGIGRSVSHSLVEQIARAGNGECEIVTVLLTRS